LNMDWCLELDEEGGRLADPNGVTRARFSRADAEDRLMLPSFWLDIQDVGVRSDPQEVFLTKLGETASLSETIWFAPEAKAVDCIKTYLLNAFASKGLVAINAMRKEGWQDTLGGFGVILLFALIGVWNVYLVWPAIFGLPLIARGMRELNLARRASQLLPSVSREKKEASHRGS
jgi:hypothetical protein